jgi:hypothetical protein
MANQPWLDEVRERLANQCLPPSYIARFMEELFDHFQDVTEDMMDTEADVQSRLGKAEQVAAAAVDAYRRRSFLGRHPAAAFFVFAITPLLSLILMAALVFLAFALFSAVLGYPAFIDDLWLLDKRGFLAGAVATLSTIVIPSLLVSMLYGELVSCLGIGRKWIFVACTVLAVMAGATCWIATPGGPGSMDSLSISIGFHTPLQLLHGIIPLVVVWWFVRRKREQTYPATTFFVFGVSPLLAFTILWWVAFFAFYAAAGIGLGFDGDFTQVGTAGRLTSLYVATLATLVLPAVLLGVLYGRLAKRLRAGNQWANVSCALLAALAGVCHYQVGPADSRLCMDVGFYNIAQLPQFVIPLAVGWWFLRRTRNQGLLQLAS